MMNNESMEECMEAQLSSEVSEPVLGLKMITREFKKDKFALISLTVLILIIAVTFIGAFVIDQNRVMMVDLFERYAPPGEKFILGADEGGRDVLGQLLIGARNSIIIGFAITIITSVVGVGIGITSGYYGGKIDNIIMRIVDFIMILPMMMIIIVFITIIPKYNVWTFILVMSAFYWVAKARLFRSKTLSEARKDYVSASKTLGTSDFKIMFHEIMPNLSSLIITNLTMNFAGNIGIETTLTFLGFGLPANVPSLGTLIGFASSGDVLVNKQWVWLPASVLILVLMLSINYVGQAFKRAADAKQRWG
jgi:peptide/nickel transport system permease protein